MDESLFLFINSLAGKSRILDLLGIFLADYLGYFLILIVIYLVLSKTDWRIRCRYFSFIILTLVLSRGLFTEFIRYFYSRPRPFAALDFAPLISHEATASFPSGHAAIYFALAAAVFFLLGRLWGWRFLLAALIIGFARIFAGVHWPLDIIGGLLVALLSFWIVKYLFEYKEPDKIPRIDSRPVL